MPTIPHTSFSNLNHCQTQMLIQSLPSSSPSCFTLGWRYRLSNFLPCSTSDCLYPYKCPPFILSCASLLCSNVRPVYPYTAGSRRSRERRVGSVTLFTCHRLSVSRVCLLHAVSFSLCVYASKYMAVKGGFFLWL